MFCGAATFKSAPQGRGVRTSCCWAASARGRERPHRSREAQNKIFFQAEPERTASVFSFYSGNIRSRRFPKGGRAGRGISPGRTEKESFPGKRRVGNFFWEERSGRGFLKGGSESGNRSGIKILLKGGRAERVPPKTADRKKAASEGLRENRHLKILHGRKRERKILLS